MRNDFRTKPLKLLAAAFAFLLLLAGCAGRLSPERQRLLAFGASMAEKNGMGFEAVFDRDGDFAGQCKETLASAWAVTDEASAREALTWLLEEGIREFSNETYSADEILFIAQSPDSAGEEELAALRDELMSYNECAEALKSGYGYTDETLNGLPTLAAFDYDRLVTLGRWCVKCGYISEADFFAYAEASALSAEKLYGSWEEYYAAVMLGRAVSAGWSAIETEIADRLLKSEESPYKKYAFAADTE